MYSIESERGAQWLKWDCHVHTPMSYQNEFTSFEDYVEGLKQAALAHGISVVIINDYFTLDGYKKITNEYCKKCSETNRYYLEILEDRKLFILPGVELRIDNFTQEGTAVNIHVFFNERLSVEQIENNFLGKLLFRKDGKLIEFTHDKLVRLGYALRNEEQYKESLNIEAIPISEQITYKNKAYSDITLKYEHIIDAKHQLESIFDNDEELANNCALVIVPFKGHGSVDDVATKVWSGRAGEIKKEILRDADMCLASNKKDINFLQGIGRNVDKSEIIKCFRTLKPCIWGSDAHKNENLCYPSNGNTKKYTWIKAMPSFNGIKQILFEPETRVKIQEEYPEIKINNTVIDKVRFICEDNKFPSKDINMNQNLNTIIGGKSSGKSLLLNSIASTINGSNEFKYSKLRNKYPFDFEVYWKDGTVDTLSNLGTKAKKTKYISQMYITNFIEENEKLDLEILEILLENQQVQEIYNKFKFGKSNLSAEIQSLMYSLEQISNEMRNIDEMQQKNGDINLVKNEINNLRHQKEEIIKESSMTEEELKKYVALNNRIDEIKGRIQKLKEACEKGLKENIIYLNQQKSGIREFLDALKDDAGIGINECYKAVYEPILDMYEKGIIQLQNKTDEINQDIEVLEKECQEKNKALKPYENKMKQKDIIKSIDEELLKKETIQKDLEVLIAEKLEKTNEMEMCIDRLSAVAISYDGIYTEFVKSFVATNLGNADEDMTISLEYYRNHKKLIETLEEVLHKTALNNKQLVDEVKDSEWCDVDYIKRLIKRCLAGNFTCKGVYGRHNLIKVLIDDYYQYRFDIVSQDISFYDMSPGKQGLMLLKLILHMSNEKYPILLDQPEDNLDNRTISIELKDFIKSKKVSRQIIMVTHNANLAVLTDSEEIIVANQRGKQEVEQDTLFDYVTGPIELSFNIDEDKLLYKRGIKEHLCEVLEGGVEAFKARENKYEINRMLVRKL